MENRKYKAVELFAGIGGFRLACDHLGIETVWANDMSPDSIKVYEDNFGKGSIVFGDINKLIDDIPEHDILTGGFPCQPFSRAGKKKGVDDYRGTLFESIVKIVDRHRPEFFVLENVNSILFMQDGRNFRTILSALSGLGYKIEWRVFNATEFGLPQNRNRVVITGSRDGVFDGSYLTDSEELGEEVSSVVSDYVMWKDIVSSEGAFCNWGMAYGGKFVTHGTDIHPATGISVAGILQDESEVDGLFYFDVGMVERLKDSEFVGKKYKGVSILYNQKGGAKMGYTVFGTDGLSPALTASTSRHYERYKVGDRYRRLTNVEYARLQGFPDDHCKAVSPYKQYKLYGNAVPHQIVEFVIGKLVKGEMSEISSKNEKLFD